MEKTLDQQFFDACNESNLDALNDLFKHPDYHKHLGNNALLNATKRGSLKLVKFFLTSDSIEQSLRPNVYIDFLPRVPSGVLMASYFFKHEDILSFVLYDLKIEVCRDTRNYIDFHQHQDLIDLIAKRDLFFSMQEKLKLDDTENDQIKKNRFKIKL